MTSKKNGKGKGSKRAPYGKPSDIHKAAEAEGVLRESDRRFREMLENVHLVALMLDEQANITFCNRYLLDLTGWELEEVEGKNWFDLFVPSDAEVKRMFRESLTQGTIPPNYQNDILKRDGERRRIAWNNTLLRDLQGNIVGATSIGEDITDRNKAEEEIKIKSEELQSLNKIIHKIIETVDLKNRLGFIMDEALKIVGLEGGTICLINPDNTFDLAVHRETSEETINDLTMHRIKIGECLCGNSAKDCKPLILNNRGEVLEFATREVLRGEDIRFHAAFPFVMGGKSIGVLCVFTRTDNKPTERSLKLLETVVAQTAMTIDNARLYMDLLESEEMLSAIFKTAPGSMILSSLPDGKTVYVNNNFTSITGYSREEIVGKTTADLNMWADPSARDRFLSMLQADGAVLDFEADMNHKSGAIRNGLVSGHILTIKGNKYLIATFYDITERKRAEEELRRYRDHLVELVEERTSELAAANERLRDLDRLKSMFIASMSHELRTPLNSIIGFTGILLQGLSGDLNDEQKDQLRRVYGSGKHLLALISDVIDISKIEAGKMDARVTEFSLTGVLQDAVGTLKQEIARKGIDLEIRSPPDVVMRTDRRRLLQCVLNYLSNAVKFTEKGTIRIVAREMDETVEIRVEDTGIGIRAEDIPKIFESFVRLESPLKVGAPGTGLGLYLTKKIVTEILGGEVAVESTPGAGSVFTLMIPKHLPERGGMCR